MSISGWVDCVSVPSGGLCWSAINPAMAPVVAKLTVEYWVCVLERMLGARLTKTGEREYHIAVLLIESAMLGL